MCVLYLSYTDNKLMTHQQVVGWGTWVWSVALCWMVCGVPIQISFSTGASVTVSFKLDLTTRQMLAIKSQLLLLCYYCLASFSRNELQLFKVSLKDIWLIHWIARQPGTTTQGKGVQSPLQLFNDTLNSFWVVPLIRMATGGTAS